MRAWLAQRLRFQIHYTPTYACWLNQVERWFALLTSREIRRGSFASAKDLVARITAFVAGYHARPRPFGWTATADDILAKLARVCNVSSWDFTLAGGIQDRTSIERIPFAVFVHENRN